MKKIIVLALALTLLFTAALAEDLSSLSDEELMEYYRRVEEEEEQRGLLEKQDIQECVWRFFSCWFSGDTEGMLNLCSSEWLAPLESAETALWGILGNRKPVNYTPGEVSGEHGDAVRTVSCRVLMDNNDGKDPVEVEFHIDVREEDGTWCLDPGCLEASLKYRDLASLSDEELTELSESLREEVEKRSLAVDQACSDRLGDFFMYWANSCYENMLELCSTEWKSACADPRTELFRILANRIPLSVEVSDLNGDPTESSRTLTVKTRLDRQNGKPAAEYLFHVGMVKEEDGNWYVDPRGLNPSLEEDEENSAFVPFDDAPYDEQADGNGQAGTVLYYVPEGGEKYHVDPNCPTVNDKYTPMQGTFLYGQVNDEPYSGLRPCPVCGAPER